MTLDEECVALYRDSRDCWVLGESTNSDYWRAEALRRYRQIRRDHGVELYYEVELPEIFRLIHPLGTVLGRASYADYLVAYQNVSVGSDVDGGRPTFLGPCVLFPGSKILGNVQVGANVWVTAGTKIEARPGQYVEIPEYTVVHQVMQAKARDGLFVHEISHACSRTTRSVRERFFSNSNRQGE